MTQPNFEDSIQKTTDGVDLFTRTWPPRGTSSDGRALLLYTHGIESHTGWFEKTGEYLAEQGHPVVSIDRRGCGRSGGPRGHMDSYDQVVEDLVRFVQSHQEVWPGRKTLLMGLSLGGLFAVTVAMKCPNLVSGVVSLVPAIATQLTVPPSRFLAKMFSTAFSPRRLFPVPIPVEMFTDQPAACEFIQADPLRIRSASARFFWSLIRMRGWVNRHPERMTAPLLTLLAENDTVVDNIGIRRWLDRVRVEPMETVEYPSVKHSILFEPCREKVLADTLRFARRVEAL